MCVCDVIAKSADWLGCMKFVLLATSFSRIKKNKTYYLQLFYLTQCCICLPRKKHFCHANVKWSSTESHSHALTTLHSLFLFYFFFLISPKPVWMEIKENCFCPCANSFFLLTFHYLILYIYILIPKCNQDC